MSEDDQTRREGDGADVPPPGPLEAGPGEGRDEDALRSLARLESLTKGETSQAPPRVSSALRRVRPRLTVSSRPGLTWARVAAPVAFLVAVIVVVSVAFQSGVVGGAQDDAKPVPKTTKGATRSPKPGASAKATSTPAAAGETRTYAIKPGDTLSGIAARFDTSVTDIEELNPDVDLTTLQPGQEIIVPRP